MENANLGVNVGAVEINANNVPRPKKKKNIWLIVILVILVLLIVGLTVGILIKTFSGNSDMVGESIKDVVIGDGVITVGGEEIDCANPETIRDQVNVSLCIQEEYTKKYEDGEASKSKLEAAAIEKYDLAIEAAKEREDYYAAGALLVNRSNFIYVYGGSCDEALKVLDEADLSDFPKDDLLGIYSQAASLAMECSDTDLLKKWEDLYNETNQ